MKRKINRVGQNTLTVSLPSKWTKLNGVKVGDEIDVVEDKSSLIINTEKKRLRLKKRTGKIIVKDISKIMLNRIIQEMYLEGLDKIEIRYDEQYIDNYKNNNKIRVDQHINKLLNRLIGMEIIEQTSEKIVLGSLMDHETVSDINIIQKRLYFLIKNLVNEFIISLDDNFAEFNKGLYDYHDNILKFTLYYLRLLKSSDISDGKKLRLFSLFTTIDMIIDKIRHTGERIIESKKITKLTKTTINDCFGLFIELFDMIINPNHKFSDMKSTIQKRYKLVKKILNTNFTLEEFKIISEIKIMLDVSADFMEANAALNIEKMIDNE